MNANPRKSLQVPMSFFIMGTLSSAATLIALEKYKVALLAVSTAGLCLLIVALVVWAINWMHGEDE